METTFKLEKSIYLLRGERVMLDQDLAQLYGVTTKALNQQVQRNLLRFPSDFMFQCTIEDLDDLRSQIVTANPLTTQNHKRRTLPYAFTEFGVAMLSSVLNSSRAIQVNITIMRTFLKLRSYLSLEASRLESLEEDTAQMFKVVFKRLDGVEEILRPRLNPKRKRIGLSAKGET